MKHHLRPILRSLAILLLAGTALAQESNIAEIYSPKDELRFLGASHSLVTHNIDEFMEPILRHGYNTVMVHGIDDDWGATYPSEFFPFAEWRNFKQDTLAKIIEACHQHEIKVIVYAPVLAFTSNPKYYDAPPGTDFSGTEAVGKGDREGKGLANLDSPFREIFVGALKEICALGADGLWLDGFGMEHYNKVGEPWAYGAAAFKEETGLEWPMKEDWESLEFRKWVKWRYQHLMETGEAIANEVRAEYPHVTLSFNTHGSTPMVIEADREGPPLTWNRWREAIPLGRFPDVLGASNHARLGPSNVAQSTPFWMSMSSDMNPLRCDLWQPTFTEVIRLGMWDAAIPSDGLGLRMSALTTFTYGSQIWPEGNIHTGSGRETEMYTKINDAIKAREAYFGGERVKFCGVVLSNNTRDFWGLRQAIKGGERNTDRLFTESFFGLASVLMMEQIQYAHIFDNTLTPENLAQFSVIVLPNVACLSDEACDTIREYVRGGGRVIATYETSLYDAWGDPREDFGLADVFGVHYQDSLFRTELDPPMWNRHLEEPALNDGNDAFIWQTRRTVVTPEPAAEVLASDAKAPYFAGEPAPDVIGGVAISRNNFGEGEAIYIVDDVSQGYYQAPFRTIPTMLRNLIHESTPPYTIEAPPQIITNAFWQDGGNRLVIHLLNLPSMSTRLFERSQLDTLDYITPVHDIQISFDGKQSIEKVTIVPSDEALRVQSSSGHPERVTVPKVEEHVMVVVDFHTKTTDG